MPNRNIQVDDEAIAWILRLRDATPEDWEAFTKWLEADPAHAVAYDVVALADADAERLARQARPVAPRPFDVSETGSRSTGRRQILGWGIAAAILGFVGIGTLQRESDTYIVETGAGEQRVVSLADGSRIDLNGSTRIVLDRENVRFASLEQGEALFTVRHDDADPFEVRTGDTLLRDMGTVFNVVRLGHSLEVAVAEGAVLYNPDKQAVNLTPGMRLRRSGAALPQIDRRDIDAISSWREGQLSYAGASASEVAGDLARNLGVPVQAAPAIEDQRFTGVIYLDGSPEEVFHRTALVMGVNARRTGDGWILTKSGESS